MSPDPTSPSRERSSEDSRIAEAALAADLEAVALRRDKAALARLFAFYAPRIKAHLLRSGGLDRLAEDVTQEVILAIWQRAHQFDPSKVAPSTWVFAIARDVRVGRLRRMQRSPTEEEASLPVANAGAPLHGHGLVEAEAMRQVLLQTIERLPEEQAELVRVFYFADEPQRTIAAEPRLRRVLARLRAMVDGLR